MKPQSILVLVLGICLTIFGLFVIIRGGGLGGLIPLIIGLSLCYLGWRGGRVPLIIFGHACIVVGCLLITWGMYLLPYSQPTLLHTFTRPLFWGLFSVFGGFCANFHAFCRCMRSKE